MAAPSLPPFDGLTSLLLNPRAACSPAERRHVPECTGGFLDFASAVLCLCLCLSVSSCVISFAHCSFLIECRHAHSAKSPNFKNSGSAHCLPVVPSDALHNRTGRPLRCSRRDPIASQVRATLEKGLECWLSSLDFMFWEEICVKDFE